MLNQTYHLFCIGRYFSKAFSIFLLIFILLKGSRATLIACPSGGVINAPCQFSPGEHRLKSLDIQADVFLESSSAIANHTFIISGDFILRSTAVLSLGYNRLTKTPGDAFGNSGGSHGGQGGAESNVTLNVHQNTPYGCSSVVNTLGSRGGNGGFGGGLLKIRANNLIINGSIMANGEHGRKNRKSGGGSGGGVSIVCATFSGVGNIQASGGLGRNYGGGGSGGRISINCKSDTFHGSFYAQGGKTEEDMVPLDSYVLSASSSKRITTHRNQIINFLPSNAMIDGNSAWIPNQSALGEYLQVEFTSSKIVTGIATKGQRILNADKFVQNYTLQYRVENTWIDYKEFGVKKIFVGNSDSSSIVKNFFSTPLSVKALRIYPQSWNNETALRIAVYTHPPKSIENCVDPLPTREANLGEPGAAGTVYRSHQNDGKTTSTLQINNDFNKIRMNSRSKFEHIKTTGAVTWLILEEEGKSYINNVDIRGNARLLVSGKKSDSLHLHSIRSDSSGQVFVEPMVTVKVSKQISPCFYAFNSSVIVIGNETGAAVTIQRTFHIYGELDLSNSPAVEMGRYGGSFAMHPGSKPNELKFNNFVINDSPGYQVDLLQNNNTKVLRVTSGEFIMGIGSAFITKKELTLLAEDVIINGLFIAPKFTSMDWKSLTIKTQGSLDTRIVSKELRANDIVVDGNFTLQNSNISIMANNLNVSGRLLVNGFLKLFDKNGASDVYINVHNNGMLKILGNSNFPQSNFSEIRARDIRVFGAFHVGTVNALEGWQHIHIGPRGEFILSLTNELRTDEIIVSGALEIKNSVSIRGKTEMQTRLLAIRNSGRITLNSLKSETVSSLRVYEVLVDGIFQAGIVSPGQGWNTFTIGNQGNMTVSFNETFHVDKMLISGSLVVKNEIKIHGYGLQRTASVMNLGTGSHVKFMADNYNVSCGNTTNFSEIHVDVLTIGGIFEAGPLSIAHGINDLRIYQSGDFRFYPIGEFWFNKFYVNGSMTSYKEVIIEGQNSLPIAHAHFGPSSNVVLGKCFGYSKIAALRVTVAGNVVTNLLTIGYSWQNLIVTGTFEFIPAEAFKINNTVIDGTMRSKIPFDDKMTLSGDTLTINDGGLLRLNYQEELENKNDGSEPSVIKMAYSIAIHGRIQAGSLHMSANDLTISKNGIITVDWGGYVGGRGPGAGSSASLGSSGASHGGRGGKGAGTSCHNLPYGSIYSSGTWGSGGGGESETGGRGGGIVYLQVMKTVQVDGKIQASGEPGKGGNAGGGSGGSIWINCTRLNGEGHLSANGGNGYGEGGAGSGGRITVNYQVGIFHSDHTWAHGGTANSQNAENGGPGIVYLEGRLPTVNKNLRIDNKGRKALVYDGKNFESFASTGAVAYLAPETKNMKLDFTFVELYGGSHLYIDGNRTEMSARFVQGDDTGFIHIAPGNILRLTGESVYRRTNVTWAPRVYHGAQFILPNATIEFRLVNAEYPELKRPTHIDFWGQVVGNLAHLMVGYGATLTFTDIAPRALTFVGITIQKKGKLVFQSKYGNTSDRWNINLKKGLGPLRRDGKLTVEGGGHLEARCLKLSAESVDVHYEGYVDLNGQGYIADQGVGAGQLPGSGAGHGGSGGSDTNGRSPGSPYSSLFSPNQFGSGGGGSNGGSGGGYLEIETKNLLVVDGTVRANGMSSSNHGGGSGGSVMITTNRLEGSGKITVNGGGTAAGGGSGGRLAIRWQDREWWFGELQAFGGVSSSSKYGGAGTIYLQDNRHGVLNRTLIIDNNNNSPPSPEIDFSSWNFKNEGSRTWFHFNESELDFEEVHIIRHGELSLFPNVTRAVRVHKFVGDTTGVLHVGPGQTVIGQFADDGEFEVNTYVYKDGVFHLPKSFLCRKIKLTNRGTINMYDVTIARDCHLLLSLTGTTRLARKMGTFQFHHLIIADGGELTSTDDVRNSSITLVMDDGNVQGGGRLHMTNLIIKAANFTVDDLGTVQGDVYDNSCIQGNGLSSTYGSSGAGHGGSGGVGSNQKRVGIPFGNLYEPRHFGCHGGGASGVGLGGGIIKMTVSNKLKLDGSITCSGSSGTAVASGGGSGGSLWIETNLIQGYGRLQVNGGNGHANYRWSSNIYYDGGGGAGGRMAVYFRNNRTYSGTFEAFGGNGGIRGGTAGGAGTIFIYHLVHHHRTLIVSNKQRSPLKPRDQPITNYTDLSLIPGTAWLLTEDKIHEFAKGLNYHFEELQIYGGVHLAIHEQFGGKPSLYFRHMIGDRTGTIHVGSDQLLDLNRTEIDLPFSVHVYDKGYLGLAPYTEVHGVNIHVHGVIANIENLLLHHNGHLFLNEGAKSGNVHLPDDFRFQTIRIQALGLVQFSSSPVTHKGMNLSVTSLTIEGGGKMKGNDLHIEANDVTIDFGGELSLTGGGYKLSDGTGRGVNGGINTGRGLSSQSGSSGGGHGGSGGRGSATMYVGLPYGNVYEPADFGSSGGGNQGQEGQGGGRLFLNVSNLLEVDGKITANGQNGRSNSGGGSGGSVWIYTNIIKGYGAIISNGGAGATANGGGGSGGRIAVYFQKNETFKSFSYRAYGGRNVSPRAESGGAGTVFLYHLYHEHRTLLIGNNGQSSLNKHMNYSELDREGGKAWIMPDSGIHAFADTVSNFHFEELQVFGSAHLAFWPSNTSINISIFFRDMIGDRSGMVHVGPNQDLDLKRQEIDVPFSVYVYKDAHLGLAPVTYVHGVEIILRGTLSHVLNITLHHGAQLWLLHGGRTTNMAIHQYQFDVVRIQDTAIVHAVTSPVIDPGIQLLPSLWTLKVVAYYVARDLPLPQ